MSWRVDPAHVDQVFEAWLGWLSPGGRGRAKLTPARRGKIRRAVRVHGVEDVLLLVRFGYESDHDRAVFWRDAGCLSLDFLLQPTKIDVRVEMALAHYEDAEAEDEQGTGVVYPGDHLRDRDPGPAQQVIGAVSGRRKWG